MSRTDGRLLLRCLLAVGLIAPVDSWPEKPATEPISQSLLAFEDARFAAMVRADTAWLRDALVDDLSYVHTSARSETKSQFLESVGSHALRYQEFTPKERRVRPLGGDAAAVIGLAHARVESSGKPLKFDVRYLAVYERLGERWRLVAWQTTRVP
jgi:hypothetical protein